MSDTQEIETQETQEAQPIKAPGSELDTDSLAGKVGKIPYVIETPEERAERELQERFPLASFRDIIRLIFRDRIKNGNPIQIDIFGGALMFQEIRRSSHTCIMTNGQQVQINGADILLPFFIPASLQRESAIQAERNKIAAEAQERAEAQRKGLDEFKAKAAAPLPAAAPVKKRGWFRRG